MPGLPSQPKKLLMKDMVRIRQIYGGKMKEDLAPSIIFIVPVRFSKARMKVA
jgi:hypothetical protein